VLIATTISGLSGSNVNNIGKTISSFVGAAASAGGLNSAEQCGFTGDDIRTVVLEVYGNKMD
jgi:hypothetical protein